MNVGFRRVVWMLPVMLLAGCAQSYHPFYTEPSKESVAELVGEWQPLKALDDFEGVTVTPWVCRETGTGTYEVVTYGTNAVPSALEVVSFRVARQLYCDVAAGDADQQPALNTYWVTSVCQIHTLWKVQFTNDLVTLTALNSEWLKRAGNDKQVALPFVSKNGDERLYTATSQEWEQFLTRYGTNTEVFGGDPAYILKRRPAAPPAPPKDSK